MTVVAAISDGRHVYLAGDSALTSEDHVYLTADPKVFERDGIVLGFCGSLRFGELIALAPIPQLRGDLDLWVRKDLCRSFQQYAKDRGFELGLDDEQDDSEAILGIQGTIYVISAGAVAYRPRGTFAAIGSGAPWAEGSLHSSTGKPRQRLVKALEASETYCAGVRRPWSFANA